MGATNILKLWLIPQQPEAMCQARHFPQQLSTTSRSNPQTCVNHFLQQPENMRQPHHSATS
eukprot:12898568-Prorocentrum_lima.AAC.1